MKLAVYGLTSTLLVVTAVFVAFYQRPNFYSAAIYLSQNNIAFLILCNLAVMITIFIERLALTIFFGDLRSHETERLYEQLWFTGMETGLALTIFRDAFDLRFLSVLLLLMFVKVFHWLITERIKYLDLIPDAQKLLFHVRCISTLTMLFVVDAVLIDYCLQDMFNKRANQMLIFAFEFALLEVQCFRNIYHYALDCYEVYVYRRILRAQLQRENDLEGVETIDEEVWEPKMLYVFVFDLFADALSILIYMAFFAIVISFYGLPLHIVRDVYRTTRSFITRIRDFIKYRKAVQQMNSCYADPTPEELDRDNVCIICREEMTLNPDQRTRRKPKKLPCSHILHLGCLKSWLERQQRCPTCRQPVQPERFSSSTRTQTSVARTITQTFQPTAATSAPAPLNRPTTGAADHHTTGTTDTAWAPSAPSPTHTRPVPTHSTSNEEEDTINWPFASPAPDDYIVFKIKDAADGPVIVSGSTQIPLSTLQRQAPFSVINIAMPVPPGSTFVAPNVPPSQ
ncbi:hypothetical protein CANCADRAFT_42196 [Tortispora caseinolytica NRRL Y-17796]|uniref:RING-type E3 ubiquitin transferase n=1 Tax=Tortispora caseinolytica NRRL Y-17796 TaxID=767744 RepID=A0A1E4TIG7_9ASCO|nr:hypothetical protein CANCADRAFT_42196 [Tortispora caseinolytica NRRL Y-17796]